VVARAPRRGRALMAVATRVGLLGTVPSPTSRNYSRSRRVRRRLQSLKGRASPGRAPPYSAVVSASNLGAGGTSSQSALSIRYVCFAA
jgi:hypothetical protein